jgi:hypothetical protein
MGCPALTVRLAIQIPPAVAMMSRSVIVQKSGRRLVGTGIGDGAAVAFSSEVELRAVSAEVTGATNR